MNPRTPSFRAILATSSLVVAGLVLTGCQVRPTVVSAHSHRTGSEEIVQITVRASDAETIKRRQLYFSIVVAECDKDTDGFPAEPYIQGKRAADFAFATGSEDVAIIGRVPSNIFDSYKRPCAFLRGGGYFTGTLLSSPAPIASSIAG
jgi:hypothetical protein